MRNDVARRIYVLIALPLLLEISAYAYAEERFPDKPFNQGIKKETKLSRLPLEKEKDRELAKIVSEGISFFDKLSLSKEIPY